MYLGQERGCGYGTSRFIKVVFLLQLGTEPNGNGLARQIRPHPGNSRESIDGDGRCNALSLVSERLVFSLKTSLPDCGRGSQAGHCKQCDDVTFVIHDEEEMRSYIINAKV